MIQLIYASAATTPFTPAALRLLLSKARARNTLYQVTGMLLYHDGAFLQVLEGPESGVEVIQRSIYKDPRHTNTRTLLQQTSSVREFKSWSMGFMDAGMAQTRPEGMLDYSRLAGLADGGTRARQFLRYFQQGLYRQQPAA